MNEDEFLPYAKSRYDQEYQRHQNIDTKAYQIIGFVGVITSIFSLIIGNGLSKTSVLPVILFGLTILLISIIITISALYPKKNIKTLNAEEYRKKIIDNQTVASLTKIYSQHSVHLEWVNSQKTKKLRCSLILMLIGLSISFLGTVLIIV